ncbi:MAG: hypothetical protein ACJ8IK_24160 [Burkholderiaceae bacterium]
MPGIVRLMGVAAVVALFGVGMCGFLGYFKFKSAVEAAARSRMSVPAASVRAGAQASLSLGLPLAGETHALLQRERAADPEIVEIAVVDMAGRTLLRSEASRAAAAVDVDEVRMPMRNSFDQPLGEVVVRYAGASSRDALAHMRERLVAIVAAGWAATTLLAAAGIVLAARRESTPR